MKFLKKYWKFIVPAVVLVIIIYAIFGRGNGGEETAPVLRATIKQEVQMTGKVKAASEAELAFDKSGRVLATPVKIGDQVKTGDLLVQLEASELLAQRAQMQAALDAAEAKAAEARRGKRPEELTLSQTKVTNAENDQMVTRATLLDAMRDAYAKADDAVRSKADEVFFNSRSNSAVLAFDPLDTNLKINLSSTRREIETTLIAWDKALQSPGSTELIDTTRENLELIKKFLDSLAFAVNGLSSDLTVNTYSVSQIRTDLAAARVTINTATTNFNAAFNSANAADSALAVARNELNLSRAGNTSEQIAVEEAGVAQARANVQVVDAQLAKTALRSPIDGVVTRQETKVGELVTAGTVVAGVISANSFEIEANVPEVDLAKLAVSDKGKVMLDAYGDQREFAVTVTRINPAETILEGIPTYTVILTFDQPSEDIRSGMTANITISGRTRENALTIPARAITVREGKKFVTVDDGSKKGVERVVVTGLAGADGMIEIVSGLQEGEKVIIPAQ